MKFQPTAFKAGAFVAAVLITTAMHGVMLWKFNDIATQAAANLASAATASAAATTTQLARQSAAPLELPPVLIVGSRAMLDEPESPINNGPVLMSAVDRSVLFDSK